MDENGHKSIKMRNATWQTLTRIKSRTGEPITQIVSRLADDEERRLNCTHSYPGGAEYCALCGASRKG